MRVSYLLLLLFVASGAAYEQESKRDAWFRCTMQAVDPDTECGVDPGPTEEEPRKSLVLNVRYVLKHENGGETLYESLDEPGHIVWKAKGGIIALGWGKPTAEEREKMVEME